MITLSKSGSTVTFTFDENSGYLQNGTIDVPVNSLALIIDESDMATFRKSASNDIFISARYEEFGMSKAELEAWYKAKMVSSGGGGGGGGVTPEEVQGMIDESISGLAESSAVTEEISEAVSGKVDTSAFTSYTTSTNSRLAEDEEVTARALIDINDLSENKADVSAVTEIAEAISGKADVSAVTAIDSAVSGLTERVGEDEEVTARALIDLDEKKLDASAYTPVDLSDYYTTAQTDSAITASVSGKASQSDLETVSGQVANKQDQLVSGTNIKTINNISLLGSGNIDIQGGGGTGTCTVDETTMFDIYGSGNYNNEALNMKVRYVVLDFTGDKTEQQFINVYVQFRDDNYTNYVQQDIYLDYTTSSYTLSDQSQAEYIDVTYDSTIEDFKIAVATAYTSTIFVGNINFWHGNIKVPFYTIASGSPCTVIENDVTSVISETRNTVLSGLKSASLTTNKNAITFYSHFNNGSGSEIRIQLDELDGSNSTLKPDIYVGLGTSGWTEIDITQNQCSAENLNGTKYRVTYDYSEFNTFNMNLQLSVSWAGNTQNDYITFDSETQLPSIQSIYFTAATVDWNASTKELVITYPTTIDWYGELVPVNIRRFENYACQFGQAITKLEVYGEDKQALKPYVQQNRAALGGLKLVKLTQAEYDALAPSYDSNTVYFIGDSNGYTMKIGTVNVN